MSNVPFHVHIDALVLDRGFPDFALTSRSVMLWPVAQGTQNTSNPNIRQATNPRACRIGKCNIRQRGNGCSVHASANPITTMAAAFSRNARGSILSSVSAAEWW